MDAQRLRAAFNNAVDSGDYEAALLIEAKLDAMTQQGAPMGVRAAVGNARSADDRLSVLQGIYPDAAMRDGNMAYTDQSGRPVLYNKPGLDVGDIVEHARVLPETLGAIAGGLVGAGAGPVTSAVGAGLGGAAGGRAYDLLLGTPDTRPFQQQAVGALTDVVGNATGGGSKPLSGFLSQDQLARRSASEAASEIGAPLSVAQRTGNPYADSIENWAEATLLGGPVIQKQRDRAADAVGDYLGRATYAKPGTPDATGGVIRRGLIDASDTMRGKQRAGYDAIDETFADQGNTVDSLIDVPALRGIGAEYAQKQTVTPEWNALAADPLSAKLAAITQNAEVDPSYDMIKRYRTSLREKAGNPLLAGSQGESVGTAKHIISGASRDLDEAAEALGGQAGKEARDYANRYFAQSQSQLEAVNPVLKKASDTDVYRAAKSAFQSDTGKFDDIYRLLGDESQQSVAHQLVYEMGQATPGAQGLSGTDFSVSTFMTNYNKLRQKAPENLSSISDELNAAVHNVAVASDRLKGALANTNKSKTPLGQTLQQVAPFAIAGSSLGIETGALAGALSAATPWAIAKIMTNQRLASAAARSPDAAADVIRQIVATSATEAGQ